MLLISQTDHDGRTGRKEFEKAGRNLQMPAPDRLALASSTADPESVVTRIRATSPEAIVVWTDAQLDAMIALLLKRAAPGARIFLCTKSAQLGFDSDREIFNTVPAKETADSEEIWVVAPRAEAQNEEKRAFTERYISRTGIVPGHAAFQTHDAVRMLAAALRSAGASCVLLRDSLASGAKFHGLAGTHSFDPAGNLVQEFAVVQIHLPACAPAGVRAQNSQTDDR